MTAIDESTTLYTTDDSSYISTTTSRYTPFPSMTQSQRQRMNPFLPSSFNQFEHAQPEQEHEQPVQAEHMQPEQHEQEQKQTEGCCLIL